MPFLLHLRGACRDLLSAARAKAARQLGAAPRPARPPLPQERDAGPTCAAGKASA
jgi:hypothetical protein